MLFLDAVLSAVDPQAQRSTVDELCDDLVEIFNTLLNVLSISQNKLCHLILGSDEAILVHEVLSKSLSVVELLITTKGTKIGLKDLIVVNNPCIK